MKRSPSPSSPTRCDCGEERPGGTPRTFCLGRLCLRPAFPKVWIESPAQSNGEVDKVVGFPVVPAYLRYRLKKLPFDAKLDPDIREELAQHVWSATLQPASAIH